MKPDIDQRIERLLPAIRPGGYLLRAWPLEGGVSAFVTAFEIAMPNGERERLVMRCHGAIDKGHDRDIAQLEFRLLHTLKLAGMAVPTPVWVDDDTVTSSCLVTGFVDGTTSVDPDDIPGAMRKMATFLARLHSLDIRRSDLSLLPRRNDPVAAIRRNVALLPPSPRTDAISTALAACEATAKPNAPVLLHGDFWTGNILWRNADIAAVIDWEDAAIGDPVIDLAGARLELFAGLGHRAMDDFTAHYLSQMDIDLTNLPFWELCAASGMTAHMHKWGLDPETEAHMRQQATTFIDLTLKMMSSLQGQDNPVRNADADIRALLQRRGSVG